MVSTFTVFGSCACRDIFYSKINKDYKKFFKIAEDGIRLSYISIMQNPVSYDENSIKIYPDNRQNHNYSNWIKKDLDKTFLNVLKENDIEYMMIDTYYDVKFGVVDIGDENYITKNLELEKTAFFQNLETKNVLNIQKDTKKYYSLWTENCNLFFEFLNEYCPNMKIILNPNRHASQVLKSDNTIENSPEYEKHCKTYNKYRDLLDAYIIKNFDVEVLKFDKKTLADENHLWGPFSLHYDKNYFLDMTNQLNEIIKQNSLTDSSEYLKLYNDFRILKRKLLFHEIKSNHEISKIKGFENFDVGDYILGEKLFEDKGTIFAFNNDWSNTKNFIRNEDYTLFFKKEDENNISTTINKDIPQKCQIEFEILNIETTNLNTYFSVIQDKFNNNLIGFTAQELHMVNKGKCIIKIDYGTICIYANNGGQIIKKFIPPEGDLQFLLTLPDEYSSFCFRNFIVKELV